MILIALFLGIIIFVGGFLLMPTQHQRLLFGGMGLIVLLASAVLMIGNDNWHWGMHHHSETTTTQIASISPSKQLSVLVYQPIRRSNTESVYVYRQTTSKRQLHTAASLKTTNRVQYRNVTQAKLVTKTTTWRYNNSFWRWLFSWTGTHHDLVGRQNTFVLPKSWITLSTHQAKWLSTAVKQREAAAKIAMTHAVTASVKKAVDANPNLTAKELAQVKQRAVTTVQKKAQQQAAPILNQLITQAKAQPVH
ncbi:DUF4811 domain-containing protein [Levilactobacillus enshiensis]|uniref:DUF4811 domain-containing protein n=1 Tax=Levilactobacillus enshiensis TaxID=2590213 RepID=UPI00117B2DD9|nr:DUF4811 domain-containing protein [Levilactobacillus enshiensis]